MHDFTAARRRVAIERVVVARLRDMTTPRWGVRPAAGRYVYWDRQATVIAIVLVITVIVPLWRLSDPNYGIVALLGSLFLPYVLGFIWLVLVALAVLERRVRAPLLAAPLLIGLLALAPYGDFPSKLRLKSSRPSMNAYVRTLPAPPPLLSRQLSDAELENYDTSFPRACPWLLGSYLIVECKTIPGGYVFLTSVSGEREGAGLAYMPGGELRNNSPAAVLEEAVFEPLGGSWYRLFSSW